MDYKLTEFLNHAQQEVDDSIAFQEVNKRFKNQRERDAYRAGLTQGVLIGKNLLARHANVKLAS